MGEKDKEVEEERGRKTRKATSGVSQGRISNKQRLLEVGHKVSGRTSL